MTYIHLVLPALLLTIFVGAYRGWRRVALAASVALLVWAWPPVAWLTSGLLEWRYPVREFPPDEVDVLVVLSGSSYEPHPSQPYALPGWNTYVRCRYAAWLYRHWRQVPIVVTGGPKTELTDMMREVLEAEGVPAEKIRVESRSRSTYENAVFTVAILRPLGVHRIGLVTEAYHMRRAEACFRKQGLEVVAAPCAYRTLEFRDAKAWLLPDSRGINFNEDALHEAVGLFWYRVTGKA